MKTAKMLILAIMVVFLADFSQAEIVSKKYDASLGKTLVEYRLVKGDNPWNIYKNNYPGRVTSKTVENEIIKPNGIVDSRRIRIGTVIKFQIKGDTTKSDTEDVAVIGETRLKMNHDVAIGIISNNLMSARGDSYDSSKLMCVDNVYRNKYINVGKEEEECGRVDRISSEFQELRKQPEVSLVKINKLEFEVDSFKKLTKERDVQILSLKETGVDELKKESWLGELKKEEAQRLNKIVLERARNNRNKWAIVTSFCLIITISYIVYEFVKEYKFNSSNGKRKGFLL